MVGMYGMGYILTNVIRFDPTGNIMEHYVDGDLVDDTQPPHRSKASPDSLHVWGKLLPPKLFASWSQPANQTNHRTRRPWRLPGVT